jgi:general secretion pathway protein F
VARPKDLALFYRTLAELLDAGVPVTGALAHAGSLLPGAGGLEAHIERGATLTQALDTATSVFPLAHRRLIAAGEASGRIEPVLKRLASFCEQGGAMWRRLLGGLVLPAAVFHLIAMLAPLPAWFRGGTLGGYLMSSVGFIAAVWLALGLGALLVRRMPAAPSDAMLRALPWFDGLWRELNLWWLLVGMEMLTCAGVGVIAALRECAGACRSGKLAAGLRRVADTAESRGEPVSVALEASGEIPAAVLARWKTGERSGYLEEAFARLASEYAARVETRLNTLAEWAPRVVYLVVCIYAAVQILRVAGARQVAG